MTFEEASTLARARLTTLCQQTSLELMLTPGAAYEHRAGWVFPFDTRRFIESGRALDAAVGTGPILVDARTGAALVLPSSRIREWLDVYAETGAAPPPPTGWRRAPE